MKTVKDLGGPTKIAKLVGLRVPTVHGWTSIPERHCPAIERGLGGSVTCEQMRPDLTWIRVPDQAWPNSAGRPLLDYSSRIPDGLSIGETSHVARELPASNDASALAQKPI